MPPPSFSFTTASWADKIIDEAGGADKELKAPLGTALFEHLTEGFTQFKSGEPIFEEDDTGDFILFIVKGTVTETSKKEEWTGRVCRTGDSIGQWTDIQGRKRPLTAVASSAVVVVKELSRSALEEIYSQIPVFKTVVEKIALKRAERRLGSMSESRLNESAVRTPLFLQHEGYLAKLCGLIGPMKQFNGKLAKGTLADKKTGGKQVSYY
jgi:CRP-like cAMP-binding protein